MTEATTLIGLVLTLVAAVGGVFPRSTRARPEPGEGTGRSREEATEQRVRESTPAIRTLPWWLALVAAVAAGSSLSLWISEWLLLSGAAALAGVLVHIALAAVAQNRALALEEGLAEAIGLATSSVRAGASPLEALERASQAIRGPARGVLEDLTGRIRLGDAPETAFADLAERVPLESFRLFSVALSVQWRAGGSLERSLSSVARALRDRVELLRRIHTQSAPTRGSVFAFVAATGVVAFLMWQNDPANLERFLRSGTGSTLVGLTVWLQAIGILWMSRIAQVEA